MLEERDGFNIRELLTAHHQEHLLTFWPQLGAKERAGLIEQVRELDLEAIDEWIGTLVKGKPQPAFQQDFEPAKSYSVTPPTRNLERKYKKANELGEKIISQGKVAALTVAGGQGTRLGFDGPKGNFPISPIRNKTLFRIFAETIEAVSKRYKTVCPWYIMTSPLNHQQTVDIFRTDNHYGLDPKNIFIFQQGTLPNFGFEGRILLADKDHIARSPDGHGGCIRALARSGALADMKRRGVEYLSYWQVDNPLVRLFDPLFIGLHVLDGAQMSSKVCRKRDFTEKVGVIALQGGRTTVIEYSDMPDDMRYAVDGQGTMVYWAGSIAIHLLRLDFVERLTDGGLNLPFHRAVKKIPAMDEQGRPVEIEGIKFETFIFDALRFAESSVTLEVRREDEFAPVKNRTGEDSLDSSRAMQSSLHRAWLEGAGITVAEGAAVEISPLKALDREDVARRAAEWPREIRHDAYFE